MKILMLEKCARNEQQRQGVSKVISILDLRGKVQAIYRRTKKAPEGASLSHLTSSILELVTYAEVVTNTARLEAA